MSSVTSSLIDEANAVLTNVRFWGRYFTSPESSSYEPKLENKVLRDKNIRVLPLGRQTKRVNGSEQSGFADGQKNALAVLEAFGADYLAKQGGPLLIFLDVEDVPEKGQPALSREYWIGWTKGLAEGSRGTKVTFWPALYTRQYADETWKNLAAAMKAGAPCKALYVAHWLHNDKIPIPPPDWSSKYTTPTTTIDCPVYIWQYQEGKSYDCDELNPNLDGEAFLRYLILPPAEATAEDTTSSQEEQEEQEGLDVSHWQNEIDWAKVVASGKQFAFVKATQGSDRVDANFATYWSAMRQTGLLRGAYHYFDQAADGAAQAAHFLATVSFEPGDLPPVLSVMPAKNPPTDDEKRKLIPGIQAWLDAVETKLGCRPILLTNPSFWNEYGSDQFGRYPLWVDGRGADKPSLPKGWADWTFWQYSDQGEVAGIQGPVLLDRCQDLEAVPRIPDKQGSSVDTTTIPPRPADAMTGSQFVAEVQRENYSQARRDQRVLYEILSGNIPTFYRQLVEVTVSETIGGVPHRATYRVMPDYLAIGSDDDSLRIPMTPLTAQVFGDEFGFMLPTPKMVDQIHEAAAVKLDAKHLTISIGNDDPKDEALKFRHFVEHNDMIQTQLSQASATIGLLVDGDKKDVVSSTRIHSSPGKVVIYGWHCCESNCTCGNTLGQWQPLYSGHGLDYMDYSHGLRMVARTVMVDGQAMDLADLLKDPALCKLVSGEGQVLYPRYEGKATTPLPPPGKPPYVPPPEVPLTVADHGLCVWHSTRLELDRGVKQYGQGKSWEIWGDNQGPLVKEYQDSVGAGSGSKWCGCFVGYNYLKAGFDGQSQIPADWTPDKKAEPRKTIFLSAYRLHLYFEKANCPRVAFPTSGLSTRDACRKWLDDMLASFVPQPGDVLLFHTSSDYSHVGIVASYDPQTYELVTYEGNIDNRAGAWRWDLSDPSMSGFRRINMIARFTTVELTKDPQIAPSGPSPDPLIEFGNTSGTT